MAVLLFIDSRLSILPTAGQLIFLVSTTSFCNYYGYQQSTHKYHPVLLDQAISALKMLPPPTIISSTSPPKWLFWRYECRDLPAHCEAKRHNTPICYFCEALEPLRTICANAPVESSERWPQYIKKTPKLFENAQSLFAEVSSNVGGEGVLPSELVRRVYFNAKFGTAFFRDGVPPVVESNKHGARYQQLYFATTGNMDLWRKIDAIFIYALYHLAKLAPDVAQHVHGIFYRCEIRTNRNNNNLYANLEDLPGVGRLEIWIDNIRNKELLDRTLIDNIQKSIDEQQLLPEEYNKFSFKSNNFNYQQQ